MKIHCDCGTDKGLAPGLRSWGGGACGPETTGGDQYYYVVWAALAHNPLAVYLYVVRPVEEAEYNPSHLVPTE